MTRWTRKQIKTHAEVRTPKYKMRVVPLVRNEKRERAIEQIAKEELEEHCNEDILDDPGAG